MQKKSRTQIPALLFGTLIGIVAVMMLARMVSPLGILDGSLSSVIVFLTLPLTFASVYINMILHELGHLICGLRSGYEFVSFRISGTLFLRENGKLVRRHFKVPGIPGQCLMNPPEPVDGQFPHRLYHLGGCLANLLCGALGLAGYFVFARSLPFLAYCSTIFALLFLYPRPSQFDSHGHQRWQKSFHPA